MIKKWVLAFLTCAIFAVANEEEERAEKLCSFTGDVFKILNEESRIVDEKNVGEIYAGFIARLHRYKDGSDSKIASLADMFIRSFKSANEDKESIGDAVSSLGQLVKCSVDDKRHRENTSYLLHREVIAKELSNMEACLGERTPKRNSDYHQLMMESLADRKYDHALYAYLKIAEGRCQKLGSK